MKNPKSKRFLAMGVAASLLLLTACSDKKEAEHTEPPVISNPAGTPVGQEQQSQPTQITFDTKDDSGNGFSIKEDIPDGLNEVKEQLGLQTGDINNDPNVVVIGGESPTTTTEEQSYTPSASNLDSEALKNASTVDEKLAAIMAANGEQDTSLLTTSEEKVIEYAESTYNHKILTPTQMVKEVKDWHDENKGKAGVYQFEKDSNFYLMISAGPKSHSGYQLTVQGVYDEKNEIRVLFTLDETKSGTLAIETTPTVVIQMKKPSKKVNLYDMTE